MSTAVQVSPRPDKVPPKETSTGPRKDPLEDDDEDSINDVESLKKGIVKTSKNKANASYTILLVGETGVGKSSVLEFIANILIGRDIDHYDFEILDHTNEQHGSDNQSQTNSARVYELRSKNGIVVRVLDTPGLADTRGLQQDDLHKRSIATQIKSHIDSVTAVLILANGTVPRVTVGTDYALSTLSAIFPKSLARNTAFMFTNVLSPLHWNFSGDTVPNSLKDAPYFLLNNPVALQRKYLKIKDDPNMKKTRAGLCKAVKASEEGALDTLVELFDWLDGLEPQPMMENASRSMGHVPANKEDNPIICTPAKPGTDCNYSCTVPNCSSTCSIRLFPVCVLVAVLLPWIQLVRCSRCAHPYLFHVHGSHLRSQINISNGMGYPTDKPPPLAEDNPGSPSSVGLSAHVEEATRLLERNHAYMEDNGVSRKQLENMQGSLERMKWGLGLLGKATGIVQKGVRKTKETFIGG